MIIDDEHDICFLVKRTLEINNFDVAVAGNITEGLALFKKYNPDGLILDINLPDGNGANEVPNFKEVKKNIKIILMSANNDQLISSYQKVGAVAFLQKPFGFGELMNVLKTI